MIIPIFLYSKISTFNIQYSISNNPFPFSLLNFPIPHLGLNRVPTWHPLLQLLQKSPAMLPGRFLISIGQKSWKGHCAHHHFLNLLNFDFLQLGMLFLDFFPDAGLIWVNKSPGDFQFFLLPGRLSNPDWRIIVKYIFQIAQFFFPNHQIHEIQLFLFEACRREN